VARHRIRITIEYEEPITDELIDIWNESFWQENGRPVYEGVVAVAVTDASLTDADQERLRGQAAVARGKVKPRSHLRSQS
jgi:hypothetical protein